MLRKSASENTKIALTWTPEGKRRRGRPWETGRTVEKERAEFGFKVWMEACTCAKNREAWREKTQGPISGPHKEKDMMMMLETCD